MPPGRFAWIRSSWLRIALAAAVFWALSRYVGAGEIVSLTRRASAPWLAAAVVLYAIDQALAVYKWQLLLAGLGLRVPFGSLFRTATSGAFVAFFVPSALSADLYKGIATTRSLGAGAQVASSIVLERLLGIASIVVVGLLCLGWLPRAIAGLDTAATLGIAALVLVGGMGAFLHADAILRAVESHLPRRLAGLAGRLEELARAFGAYRSERAILAATFALSVAIQFARSTAAFFVARAIGDATPYWAFPVFVPYVYLVNLLPFATSRLGLEQGAFVVLFAAVGMPADVAVAVSLLSVLASLVVAVPGGLWLVADRAALRRRPGL